MRKQAEISKLTDDAMRIDFPRFDVKLDRFTATLRELVRENFGNTVDGLEYDEYTGTFYFKKEVHVARLGETVFRASRTFSIDPKKPLHPQFARIAGELEVFEVAQVTVGRAIVASGGKV